MKCGRTIVCLCVLLGGAGLVVAGDDPDMVDPSGDAVARRTDAGADGVVNPASVLPDLVSVVLEGWLAPNPVADPYTGAPDPSDDPDLLRIEVRFAGLVNPPGTIGLGGHPFNPFEFGPSPVYGFVEIDVDDEIETGGELTPEALSRYMANVGRFGVGAVGSLDDRIVRRPGEADADFFSDPQFERSGAEFALSLCGCWSVSIIDEDGDLDGKFDAGEQWLVSGRFFERAQAFECLSGVFGGSAFGLYDPVIEARFTHELASDQTVLEIVYPLTPEGAGALLGEPEQAMDFDVSNHYSVAEALDDLILGAGFMPGAVCNVLGSGWDGRTYSEFLDPSGWEAVAIFGTAYSVQETFALYVWTDTGFGEVLGDFDGDQRASLLDTEELLDEIDDNDGTLDDADGVVNGQLGVLEFGTEFSLYDLDYDGVVGDNDIALMPCNDADLALPHWLLDFTDVLAFLGAFGGAEPAADLASPQGVFDFADMIAFLSAFGAGCP